jgi:hypothetical protein
MTPLRLHDKIEKQKLELKANLEEDGLQVWVFFGDNGRNVHLI